MQEAGSPLQLLYIHGEERASWVKLHAAGHKKESTRAEEPPPSEPGTVQRANSSAPSSASSDAMRASIARSRRAAPASCGGSHARPPGQPRAAGHWQGRPQRACPQKKTRQQRRTDVADKTRSTDHALNVARSRTPYMRTSHPERLLCHPSRETSLIATTYRRRAPQPLFPLHHPAAQLSKVAQRLLDVRRAEGGLVHRLPLWRRCCRGRPRRRRRPPRAAADARRRARGGRGGGGGRDPGGAGQAAVAAPRGGRGGHGGHAPRLRRPPVEGYQRRRSDKRHRGGRKEAYNGWGRRVARAATDRGGGGRKSRQAPVLSARCQAQDTHKCACAR